MPGRCALLLATLLLTHVSACLLSASTFADAQNSGDNYDVRISLYRPLDEAERATPRPALTFVTITVPPAGGSLPKLLLSYHLYADSDAVGLMYALNPDLRDALQPGQRVRIIQIPLTPETAKAISDGFLFKLYYDDGIIREITSSRENFRRLTGAVSALAAERFADPSLRQAVLDCLSSVSGDLDQIANHLQDRDQPTNHEMLSQVCGEVELLLRTLGRVTTQNGTITAADKSTLCAVANDLNIKKKGFENTRGSGSTFLRWPAARVMVNTLGAVTNKPVPMLTIHYAAEALQNDPTQIKQFPGLSSPAEYQLPEADYVFWATKGGEASPVSDRKPVSVRKTEDSKPLIVDIVVKQ